MVLGMGAGERGLKQLGIVVLEKLLDSGGGSPFQGVDALDQKHLKHTQSIFTVPS